MTLGVDVTSHSGLVQVILGFLQRGDRDAQKPHEFSRIISTEPLGDVGWNGPRGALNLIAESSIHDCRPNGSNRKHPIAQFNRELPGHEIFEAAYHRHQQTP